MLKRFSVSLQKAYIHGTRLVILAEDEKHAREQALLAMNDVELKILGEVENLQEIDIIELED